MTRAIAAKVQTGKGVEPKGEPGGRIFKLIGYRVIDQRHRGAEVVYSEATIRLRVNGHHTDSMGSENEANGPVNALELALKKALAERYPKAVRFRLVDYDVAIIGKKRGSGPPNIKLRLEIFDKKVFSGSIRTMTNKYFSFFWFSMNDHGGRAV